MNTIYKTVTLKQLMHKNELQIGLYFKYDDRLIEVVKKIAGMKWSVTQRCWYVKNNPENLKAVFCQLTGIANINKELFFSRPEGAEEIPAEAKPAKPPQNKIPDECYNLFV